VFAYMQEQAQLIENRMEKVGRAGMLQQQEKDPARRAAMLGEQRQLVDLLNLEVDSFLDSFTRRRGVELGWPGNYELLVEIFASAQVFRAPRLTPEAALAAAEVVLAKVRWAFEHGGDLVITMSRKKDLKWMLEQEEEEAKKKKEEH
jgi:hypothetical protein